MTSIIKVDNIQDQGGNNIINESGNVITIGASGDTITVPAGATVSGFTSAGIDDNATSTAITIDSSENVGIGVIPEAWNSNNTALQIGNAGALFASTNDSFVGLTANAYFDSINSRYEYINTDYATIYQQIDGTHIWSTAASGSADNAITFSETMRIDSSGNVGIGTSSPSRPLDVVTSNNLPIRTESSAAQNYLQQTNSTGTTYIVSTGDNFFIGTGSSGTERMRITSAGLVGIGTSSPNTKLEISASTPDIQLTDSDGTNQFATIKQDGSNLKILSRNNTVSGGIVLKRNIGGTETDAFQIQSNGDISFYDSGGSNQNLFWDASTSRLGIGTSSPTQKLDVNGTVKATGFDGSTPMVYAQGNSGTSCADNTFTKIILDNEIIDTQGLFANSRFTVTSGYEGKYLIIWQISFNHTSTAKTVIGGIYKNGSIIAYGQGFSAKSSNHTMIERTSIITDLTTNDYIEFYGRHDTGSTKSNNSGIYTNASITKLID